MKFDTMSKQKTIYPLDKPLILVGMMGVGKSSIGHRLANYYDIDFIDSDREIVDAAQMSINDIFNNFGEYYFRSGEERVISRLLEKDELFIMATGGGAILNPKTAALFEEKTVSVWIDVELSVLWERLKNSKERPILHVKNPFEALEKLNDERKPYYQKANIYVNINEENVVKTRDKIIDAVQIFAEKHIV